MLTRPWLAPPAFIVFNEAQGGRIEANAGCIRPGAVLVKGGYSGEILPTSGTLAYLGTYR